jgi:class 3 adenylate cyclase
VLDNLLQRAASADLAELMSIWRAREPEEWSQRPEFYRALGERILAQGEPLLAYDVIREGLGIWPGDVRLRQLQGLALARSGATARANAVLEKLRSEGQTDEETLGMLGRTLKDLASTAATQSERKKFLGHAAEIYTQAYEGSGGFWTGINAATMTLLVGEAERACALAQQVRDECVETLVKDAGDRYWILAALGEATLVLRDLSQAADWYARAAEEGKNRSGHLNSSRRNARLILDHWKEDSSWIDKYLRVPSVIVFAGHMIDRPGRETPRFPRELESVVAKEIRGRIEKLKPGFGFSSAACGSDILFLEAMLDRGAEISVVLPYNQDQFIRDSVEIVPVGEWRERFDRILVRSARVITASSQRLETGGISYEFCNELLLGLATIRARQLDTELIPLAVWNGITGDGPGGAASAVELWRAAGYKPEIVDLPVKGRPPSHPEIRVPRARMPPDREQLASRIVAILFADAVGFSKLSEPEVPRFVQYFLGMIADLSKKFRESIIAKNTWGDGLYFVFSDIDLAGNFALELSHLIATANWEEKGLPAGLNLRIALHAGPVYEIDDPITGSRTYTGTHVSRAARIEPVTPPGQVYASEAFAALAAAHRATGFICDYVGQTPMAKGYGTLPTYHVRHATANQRL